MLKQEKRLNISFLLFPFHIQLCEGSKAWSNLFLFPKRKSPLPKKKRALDANGKGLAAKCVAFRAPSFSGSGVQIPSLALQGVENDDNGIRQVFLVCADIRDSHPDLHLHCSNPVSLR